MRAFATLRKRWCAAHLQEVAPPAAACQNCVPGLHRVEACLHVVNSLIHHGSQVLQQVAAAACAGCLEHCDGVLGLLGVSAGSDELLPQIGVLQEKQRHTLKGHAYQGWMITCQWG